MLSNINYRIVDLVVFLCANFINILITGIMISRPFGLTKVENILGIINILLIIPLSITVVLNYLVDEIGGRMCYRWS